jgi:hypothetical protein
MSAAAPALARLQQWFSSQCNDDWEHSYGVKIETLDNPGWLVTVDLTDTAWEQLKEPRKIVERSETDWIQSEIAEGKFIGCGGPDNLEEVLELFLEKVR